MTLARRTLGSVALRFAAFLAPVILAVGSFEFWLRHSVPNVHAMKRAALMRKAESVELLVVGSSNALNGIRPEFMRLNGYNLGMAGEPIWYHAQWVLRYAPELPRLRMVIFTMMYSSLKYSLIDFPSEKSPFLYERFDDLRPEQPFRWFDSRQFSLVDLYGEDMMTFLRTNNIIDDWGWQRPVGRDGHSEAETRARIAQYEAGIKEKNFASNLAILEEAVSFVRRRGIAVGLMISPVREDFREVARPEEHALLANSLREVAAKQSSVFRDYYEDKRFAHDDFWNCDHLNEDGAAKLTRILEEEIVAPAVATSAESSHQGTR